MKGSSRIRLNDMPVIRITGPVSGGRLGGVIYSVANGGLGKHDLLSDSTRRAFPGVQQKGPPLGFGAEGLLPDSANTAFSIIFA